MNLEEFKTQHPEYKDVPDTELADQIFQKYYTGKIGREEFNQEFDIEPIRPAPSARAGPFSSQVDPRGFVPSATMKERLEDTGVSTEGAPYSTRRIGGYAQHVEFKLLGVQKDLEKQFNSPVKVRVGPVSEDIEFLNPKTLKWTTYNPPGLDAGDIPSLEAELYPTVGGITGATALGVAGSALGPGGTAVGLYSGEVIGVTIGEYHRLKKGQELGVVDPKKTENDLWVDSAVTGLLALGGTAVTNIVLNRVRSFLGSRGIDVSIDTLKQLLKERMPLHEQVGTKPTTGQLMRKTAEGDELLSAERQLQGDTSPSGQALRDRQLESDTAAQKYFDEITPPDTSGLSTETVARRIGGRAEQEVRKDLAEPERAVAKLRDDAVDEVLGFPSRQDAASTGRAIRSSLETAEDAFETQISEQLYNPLREQARGLTVQPSKVLDVTKRYYDTISKDVYHSLTEEDAKIIMDGLKLEQRTSSSLLDSAGQPMPDKTSIKSLDYDVVSRALSQLRRLERMMNRGTIPERDRAMIGQLKSAWKSEMDSLLAQKPGLTAMKTEADIAWRGQRELFREGVVSKLLGKKSGQNSYGVMDEDVFKQFFKPDNISNATQVRSALEGADNFANSSDALLGIRNSIKSQWKNDVLEPDGTVSVLKHAEFMKQYGDSAKIFLSEADVRNMTNASMFKQRIAAEEARLKTMSATVGKTVQGKIANVSDPGELFSKTWDKGNPYAARVTKELVSEEPRLEGAYRGFIREHLLKNSTKEGRLDAEKLSTYIDDYGPQLETWFGPQYTKNLNVLKEVLRDITASPRQTVRDKGPVSAIYDLVRVYVGLFTRPGRLVTAYRKLKMREGLNSLTRDLLDPAKLSRIAEIRGTLRTPQRSLAVILGELGMPELAPKVPFVELRPRPPTPEDINEMEQLR